MLITVFMGMSVADSGPLSYVVNKYFRWKKFSVMMISKYFTYQLLNEEIFNCASPIQTVLFASYQLISDYFDDNCVSR